MGTYRSKAWYEAAPNRISWTNVGLVSALLGMVFAVPVILLLGYFGVISW